MQGDKRSPLSYSYTTGGDGYYSFVDIPAGYYTVAVTSDSYLQIPLSTKFFYFDGSTQQIINLEILSYEVPVLKLAGGDFYYHEGDVLAKFEDIGTPETTFWGALFDSPQGLLNDFGFAYYRFLLPPPIENGYDYDDLKIHATAYYIGDTGVWTVGSDIDYTHREYYNWVDWGPLQPQGWYTADATTGTVPWWAVKQTTDDAGVAGEVRTRVSPIETSIMLLAYIQVEYDHHKEEDGPPIVSEVTNTPANTTTLPYNTASVGSLSTKFNLNECSFVTFDIYETGGSGDVQVVHQTYPERNGIHLWNWNFFLNMNTGRFADWHQGYYRYYITAQDQAGNAAQYGPFYVFLLDPDFSTSSKGANLLAVPQGGEVTFQINVANSTDAPAMVILRDLIPAGLTYMAGTLTVDGRMVADPSGAAIGLNFLVGERSTVPVTFVCTATALGPATNTADIEDRLQRHTNPAVTINVF